VRESLPEESVAVSDRIGRAIELGPALDASQLRELRLRAALEYGKVDLQLQDHSALADRSLLLARSAWQELSAIAERLAAESVEAEATILEHADLLEDLGLPGSVRVALRNTCGVVGSAACRIWRFDFHWTSDGWRLSEVNSDVPGGIVEASGITTLYAKHVPDCSVCGDPVARVCEAIARDAGARAHLALVHATAFAEDHLVMRHIARTFERAGGHAHLASPRQVLFSSRGASIRTSWHAGRVDAVVRFYPAEWLPSLGRGSGWRGYFRGTPIPHMNPGHAIVSQSKRCPLVWDRLGVAMSTWRRLLPETVDPRDASARPAGAWVLKPALGRVGAGVLVAGVLDDREAGNIRREAQRQPACWVAQRRFESIPVGAGPDSRHVCVGVFVVGGRAAGAYGRTSRIPLIDWRAQETAVLIRRDRADGNGYGPQ
jgi:glutathionylspermidine synthase